MAIRRAAPRTPVADPAFAGLSVLVAGLGSVGSRHLANLRTLGVRNISLFRTGKGHGKLGSRTDFPVESELAAALARHPAAVVISNPTSLHLDTALAAAGAGCHILIEKPVSHTWAGVPEFWRLAEAGKIVVATGYQFRFHPLLRTARDWLAEDRIGRIVSCRAEYGEFLPSWHPGEDYREGYSARSDMGGGPVLTLSHPFDYLRWLLGDVRSVAGSTAKLSGLEIDTEDTARAILRFANGALGSVELDYLQRPPAHRLQIVGEDGVVELDFREGTLRRTSADGGAPWNASPPPGFERNTMFVDEMRNFLAAILGREAPVCTLEDGIRALEISLAVHRSSRERREIDVGIPL